MKNWKRKLCVQIEYVQSLRIAIGNGKVEISTLS